MARRPLVRDVTRMHVSTAAFQRYDKEQGGFLPGINPAALRATDAMLHDVSNAARSISDEYGMINRGEKTMYTADDFSGTTPVYAGTAEKDFYVPREFEENLRTVMEHVSDKWDSNPLTPSVGSVGLNPQYTHEKLVGRTKIYRSQAAMRKAMQEILRRGGMTESAATAKNPYRITEWLPMPETDYNAAMAAGTLSRATSQLFKGATPDADRMSRIVAANTRKKEAERRQIEQQRETERKQKEQQRINDAAARAQKRRQQREGRMYANTVWNQFKQQERADAIKKRQQERQRRLDDAEDKKESERIKHRALVVLTAGVSLIVALLRRISQSISEIVSAGTVTIPKATAAIEGVDLGAPLANALMQQLVGIIDPFNIVSPIVNAAVEKVGELYKNRMTSFYSGIPEDKQRWYNMIDQAHGLESGTFVAGVISLGQKFANVTDLESEYDAISKLAPVLGTELTQDLVRLAVPGSGVVPAELAEKMLNAYFLNYQKGLDALNQAESDPSKRYRSLTENLANLSPELAAVLRQMLTDSMPGSLYAGFTDYEGWAFASRSAKLYEQGVLREPSGATSTAAYQWQQSWNDLSATLQKLFDERILKDMLGVLQSLLYNVTALMAKFVMDPSQQFAYYSANRAALTGEQARVDARYSDAELAMKKAFGFNDAQLAAFRQKSIKGTGKDMQLQVDSSGGYTQAQLDALSTWATALKQQQMLEEEIKSKTPIYISSLWSDETFAWTVEGTKGGVASTIKPAQQTSRNIGSYSSADLSREGLARLMPEEVVRRYEEYYMSLENALARGIAAADAGGYTSDYRYNPAMQVDYMDAFVRAGLALEKEYGTDIAGGVSFENLSKGNFISGNDITRAGMISLQGKVNWLTQNNPALLERIKALALTNLYEGTGGIRDIGLRDKYQDMISWILAGWQGDVARGNASPLAYSGDLPREFSPAYVEAMAAREEYKKTQQGLFALMLQSGAFGTIPKAQDELDLYKDVLMQVAGNLADLGYSVPSAGVFGHEGLGFKQDTRNGEMRFILEVRSKDGTEEHDITDLYNMALAGNNASASVRTSVR